MKQLHPKAIWLFFINSIVHYSIFLVMIGAGIVAISIEQSFEKGSTIEAFLVSFFKYSWWLLIVIPLFLIFIYIWARLQYHFYHYELTDKAFRKEYGVISKKYASIPYNRIQNVDIYRGFWSRILGISELQIQTAGDSIIIAEGRLPGISKNEAEQLRDELINRQNKSKNQGL